MTTDTTLRGKLIRLAYSDDSLRPHILPMLAAEGKTASDNGTELLKTLVDWRSLIILRRSLHGAHPTSTETAELLGDVMMELARVLDVDKKTSIALSKLKLLSNKGDRMDAATIRNEVIEAADALGMKTLSKLAATLPSAEKGGKPEHDDDFKAGYKAGEAAVKKDSTVSKTDAEKAYKKLSKKHGTWWVDGYCAAVDNARGATKTGPAQIAKKMKLAEDKEAVAGKRRKRKKKDTDAQVTLDSNRDPAARAMAEGQGGKGGKHHNRGRDLAKGRSRKMKHKKKYSIDSKTAATRYNWNGDLYTLSQLARHAIGKEIVNLGRKFQCHIVMDDHGTVFKITPSQFEKLRVVDMTSHSTKEKWLAGHILKLQKDLTMSQAIEYNTWAKDTRADAAEKLRWLKKKYSSELKTAAISMSDIDRINSMTDRNDHNGAAKATAALLGLKRHVKVFEGIQVIQNALGHMPPEASDLRYRMLKEVYAKAQKTYIKDEDGDKIIVYSLLD